MEKKQTKERIHMGHEPLVLQHLRPQQRLVIYGLFFGLILSAASLVISNFYLSLLPFHYGYFVILTGSSGGGVVSLHGFPFAYVGVSTIAYYFAYFAFLLNFITWTIVAIVIGLNYQRITANK